MLRTLVGGAAPDAATRGEYELLPASRDSLLTRFRSVRDWRPSWRRVVELLGRRPAGERDADADAAAGGADAAADAPAADARPRASTTGSTWLDDHALYALLLVLVWVHRHFFGIILFLWLTSLLHSANGRLRELIRAPAARPLLLLGGALVVELWLVFHLQGVVLVDQLTMRGVEDKAEEPPPMSTVVWDVVVADFTVRTAAMLLKVQLALLLALSRGAKPAAARRLRGQYALIEAASLVYRTTLPTPLWYHTLLHSAPYTAAGPAMWSLVCAHFYTGLKFLSLYDRMRAGLGLAWQHVLDVLPVGTHATAAEVMEAGEEGCTICQEELASAVRLECGHVFCEECIVAWCERAADATCPLCRAPIPSRLGQSDGTTSLMPQVF